MEFVLFERYLKFGSWTTSSQNSRGSLSPRFSSTQNSRCEFPSIFLVVFVVVPTIITLSPIDGILLKSKLPNNLMDVAFTLREESKVVNLISLKYKDKKNNQHTYRIPASASHKLSSQKDDIICIEIFDLSLYFSI